MYNRFSAFRVLVSTFLCVHSHVRVRGSPLDVFVGLYCLAVGCLCSLLSVGAAVHVVVWSSVRGSRHGCTGAAGTVDARVCVHSRVRVRGSPLDLFVGLCCLAVGCLCSLLSVGAAIHVVAWSRVRGSWHGYTGAVGTVCSVDARLFVEHGVGMVHTRMWRGHSGNRGMACSGDARHYTAVGLGVG